MHPPPESSVNTVSLTPVVFVKWLKMLLLYIKKKNLR